MSDPEEYGRVHIKYPQPLIAGQLVTVVFEYTVEEQGMREGGRLRIGLPNVGWAKPEVPQYYFWSEDGGQKSVLGVEIPGPHDVEVAKHGTSNC